VYCPNDECPDFITFGVRGEYREGLTTCPKCKGLLRRGGPPTAAEPTVAEGRPLVAIASFEFEHQASLAVSFLASKGVVAVIAADDCGRIDPILGIVTGGIRVKVPEDQAQEASALLEPQQSTDGFDGV